jgi:hypothetical protein
MSAPNTSRSSARGTTNATNATNTSSYPFPFTRLPYMQPFKHDFKKGYVRGSMVMNKAQTKVWLDRRNQWIRQHDKNQK